MAAASHAMVSQEESAVPAHTVHLLPHLEETLRRLVATGRYGDESDVVMYALARREDDEIVREARRVRLEAKIREGLADIAAGRTHDMDEVFAELESRIGQHERARDAAE